MGCAQSSLDKVENTQQPAADSAPKSAVTAIVSPAAGTAGELLGEPSPAPAAALALPELKGATPPVQDTGFTFPVQHHRPSPTPFSAAIDKPQTIPASPSRRVADLLTTRSGSLPSLDVLTAGDRSRTSSLKLLNQQYNFEVILAKQQRVSACC